MWTNRGVSRLVLSLLVLLVPLVSCSRAPSPPRVRVGAPCSKCGMTIRDTRFACVARGPRGDRAYDSIECLVLDSASTRTSAYLADYDKGELHPSDSLWVVKGSFSSPMGAGLAAFASVESAREVASRTEGRIVRFDGLREELIR